MRTMLITGLALAGCSHGTPPKPTTSAPPGPAELAGTYKGTSKVTRHAMNGTVSTESKPVQFTVEPTGVGIAIAFAPGEVPACGIGARVSGAQLEVATPESCADGTLTFARGEVRGTQLGLSVHVKGAGGVTEYEIAGERQR